MKKPLSLQAKILIGLGVACVLMVLIIIAMDAYGTRRVRFQSAEYPYSVVYTDGTYKYEKSLLGTVDGVSTYMERFLAAGADAEYYLSVVSIDPDEDLEEILETFQKDGDYSFHVEEGMTFGKGSYKATKITYLDNSGTEPAEVSYYYMKDRGLLITTCTDAKHKEAIMEMLASVELY